MLSALAWFGGLLTCWAADLVMYLPSGITSHLHMKTPSRSYPFLTGIWTVTSGLSCYKEPHGASILACLCPGTRVSENLSDRCLEVRHWVAELAPFQASTCCQTLYDVAVHAVLPWPAVRHHPRRRVSSVMSGLGGLWISAILVYGVIPPWCFNLHFSSYQHR